MEQWKPIKRAIRGGYEISSEGRIRSHMHRGSKGTFLLPQKPRLLSTGPQKAPYTVVRLVTGKGRSAMFRVHELVAEAFLGPRPPGKSAKGRCTWDIDHTSGDTRDNRAANLQYIPHAENILKGRKNPRLGHDVHCSKLTEADVLEIWRLGPTMTQAKIAEKFGVSAVTISHIFNRKTWKHVCPPR